MRRKAYLSITILVLGAITALLIYWPAGTITADPAAYTGRAREAYQAARDYPGVLAELPCFCGCMKHSGHTSNLDCFKDNHGSICSMCQDIALAARDLTRQGKSKDEVLQEVILKYNGNVAKH